MATNFRVKISEIGLLTYNSSPRHSEMDGNITLLILKGSSAIIWLHRV